MSEHSLTFREFPSLLADLVSQREVLIELRDAALLHGTALEFAQAKDVVDQCETALRLCVTELVKKADGVAAFIRSEEGGAATAKAEADRCYDLAKAREARADRVKAIALEVLQQLGVKFVKGDVSELRRWGNGGAQPVEVRQPELLPAKYQRYTLTITGIEKEELEITCAWTDRLVKEKAKPIEPDTELIRKDLMVEGPCPNCTAYAEDPQPGPCALCKDTCRVYVGSVPGAVLLDRGEHLRIK